MQELLAQYKHYRALPEKEKKKRRDEAKQSEAHRMPNPQGNHRFLETDFIDFRVEEGKKYIKLKTYRYPCTDDPIAIVIMFHGLNSHLGHGAHIAHEMSRQNIITVGFDHRGFGQSQGQPGYVDSLESHLQDSIQFVQQIRQLYKDLPIFCLGLSMGGMTSYYLTLRYPQMFAGAILMAPALKNNLGGFVTGVTKVLHKMLPDKAKLIKPKTGMACRNPQITEDILNDKWSFVERTSLSTIQMLLSTMDKSSETFHKYSCPFFIIQGGMDKLVNPEVAFELFERSKTPLHDKAILFIEEMWHDIWHQRQIHEIIERTIYWIIDRVAKIRKEQKQS